jgi:hypothetical protein
MLELHDAGHDMASIVSIIGGQKAWIGRLLKQNGREPRWSRTIRRNVIIKPMSIAQMAYSAGIIDGEGCISISRKKDKTGNKRGLAFRPFVSVTNTGKPLLDWLEETTGLGSITIRNYFDGRRKMAWLWQCWSQQAAQFVDAIRPYLVLKTEQADLLLEFMSRVGHGPFLTDEQFNFQVACYEKFLELNKRGIK